MAILCKNVLKGNILNIPTHQVPVFHPQKVIVRVQGDEVVVGLALGHGFHSVDDAVEGEAAEVESDLVVLHDRRDDLDAADVEVVHFTEARVEGDGVRERHVVETQVLHLPEVQGDAAPGIGMELALRRLLEVEANLLVAVPDAALDGDVLVAALFVCVREEEVPGPVPDAAVQHQPRFGMRLDRGVRADAQGRGDVVDALRDNHRERTRLHVQCALDRR